MKIAAIIAAVWYAFRRSFLRMPFIELSASPSRARAVTPSCFSVFVSALMASSSEKQPGQVFRCSSTNAAVSSLTMFSKYSGSTSRT